MADNKYLDQLDEFTDENQDARREERRKRRKKSRRRSVIALILVLLIITAGVAFGIITLTKSEIDLAKIENIFNKADTETEDREQEAIDEALEDLVSHEEEVIVSDETPAIEVIQEARAYEDAIADFVNSMTLDEKIYGLFIVSPESLTGVKAVTKAGEGTKDALTKYPVGGITYGKNNIASSEEFETLLTNTIGYAKYPLFLSLNSDVDTTENDYSAYGINLYRYNSNIVTLDDSFQEAGVADLSAVTESIANGAQFIIVDNAYAPNLTGDDNYMTRSKTLLTDTFRVELELHDAIIIAGPMNETKITDYFDASEAAIASLKAGADMILLPGNLNEAYKGVLDAVNRGVVSEERINDSLERIYKVKFGELSTEEILSLIPAETEETESTESESTVEGAN